MLDINYLRKNADQVTKACQDKQLDSSIVKELLSVDEKRRLLLTQIESLRAESNKNATAVIVII